MNSIDIICASGKQELKAHEISHQYYRPTRLECSKRTKMCYVLFVSVQDVVKTFTFTISPPDEFLIM